MWISARQLRWIQDKHRAIRGQCQERLERNSFAAFDFVTAVLVVVFGLWGFSEGLRFRKP
jgi:hypothetical protein